MRVVAGIVLGLCVSFACLGQQGDEESTTTSSHYISDNVVVFMHTGPGRNYRISGSIAAGIPVSRTDSETSGDYVEIVTAQGRTGWIESKYLSLEPSFRERIPELQEQVSNAEAALIPLQQRIDELGEEVAAKDAQNVALNDEILQLNESIRELEVRKSDEKQETQIRWLLNGGGLAAGCVVLGIMLSYLPRKRKRDDGWMN